MIILLSVLVATLAFSVDIGKYFDVRDQAQTVADSAALAGINVVRRVFEEDTTTMPAVCKAGFISEAVNDALTRMAAGVDEGGMGFAVDEAELIYCPRSSEPLIEDEGPCYKIPGNVDCDVDCDCGDFTEEDIETVGKPGDGFYPLDSEIAGSDAAEENSAAYFYVKIISESPVTYFADFFGILMQDIPIEVAAMARHRHKPASSCPGLFGPKEDKNDPKPIDLKDNSTLKITNGGITISDDVMQEIHNSNSPNYIYADWIKILNNYSGQITYYCGPYPYEACVPEIVTSEEIAAFEPPDEYLVTQEASREALCAGLADSCTPYTSAEGGYIYKNCKITKSMVTASGGRYDLYAGTYCGGLKITEVGGSPTSPAVVFKPRLVGGKIDDIIYLVSDDLIITGAKAKGKTPKAPSYVEVWDGGIEDGGLIIYAGSDNVSLDIGWLLARGDADPPYNYGEGSLRIHADNLILNDSRLEYRTYIDGERCTGNNVEIPLVSGLVQ